MITAAEYKKRRDTVLKALKGSTAIIFAGDHAPPAHGKWRANDHFIYLTGISNERSAAVLFDPQNPVADRRIMLFLKPIDVEAQRWDGYRQMIASTLKEETGFTSIYRTGTLPGMLTASIKRSKQAACLHPFAVYPVDVSADLKLFQQVAGRVPGVRIEDRTGLLPEMRAVKSKSEISLIERAADITVAAYSQVLRHIRPGVHESQIQLALETVYRQQGGDVAYGSIVGSGVSGTVLHYIDNNNTLEDGDLLVIDSAASYGGYTSDITRTFPVSGRFTSEQRDLYEVVLKAQLAAIKSVKPGVWMHDVDAAARQVIDNAGLGDAFIHSIGHPLGLSVHDPMPDKPLAAGMVITIEPGVYLQDRKTGIRIEDDLVVTRTGHRNITDRVPKTVKEIEAAMK